MRVTLIKEDGTVTIDGKAFNGIDMSSLPSFVHALDWNETVGDLQCKDPITGWMSNWTIHSLDPFGPVISQWEQKKHAAENPVDPPVPEIPLVVSARQVRLLLLNQGLLDDVENVIATYDRATQIAWEYATEFRRDDPLLLQVAAAIGLQPEQIDQFFAAASVL